MTEPEHDDSVVTQTARSRLSPVWLVPLAAVLIGAWLFYQNLASQGPEVTLTMDTAEGLTESKTKVKVHSVEVGHVETIRLSDNHEGAVVGVQMNADTSALLVSDSRFWVVKPRIGRQGVSGLGTIVSGAYIQLRPGDAKKTRRKYQVRDSAPSISPKKPGVAVNLTSGDASSLAVGDPIVYQGQNVGTVLKTNFVVDKRQMQYRVFIREPYDELVTDATRFWMRSGIDFHFGSSGVSVQTGSLQSIIAGGLTFGLPEGMAAGPRADNGSSYKLYTTEDAAKQDRYNQKIRYVMMLDSVSGLAAGAPVKYRGLRVGTVEKVPFFHGDSEYQQYANFQIPVLMALEPQRPSNRFADWNLREWRQHLRRFFENGLRASVKAGNLLTGSKYVDLAFDSDASDYIARRLGRYTVFPTNKDASAGIKEKVSHLADKLNDLQIEPLARDLERTLETSKTTLETVRKTTQQINALLAKRETRQLPDQLQKVLAEIRDTLASYQRGAPAYDQFKRSMNRLNQVLDDVAPLARTLRDHPNALIFGQPEGHDPVPRAAQ